MFGAASLLFAASLVGADPTPAEKAFKEFCDFHADSVWTTTNAKGEKAESRWEWILDKSFLQQTSKSGDTSECWIHGIDPASGKWTYWGFDNKGRVYKGHVETPKAGEWIFQDTGQGKAGPSSFKAKVTKLGADQVRDEILEIVEDGKKLPNEVKTWTRKR